MRRQDSRYPSRRVAWKLLLDGSVQNSHAPEPMSPGLPSFLRFVLLAGGSGLVLAGCGEGPSSPERLGSVSLAVAASSPVPGGAWTLDDGIHRIDLDRVALVVRDLVLGEGDVAACDEPTVIVRSSGCVMIETGPFLLDVPLDGTVRPLVAAVVPSGRYAGLRLTLHVAQVDDPADAAFLQAGEGVAGASVIVVGRWDGSPFRLERALEEVRVLSLAPPVDISSGTANVTLRLDLTEWFVGGDGRLVGPGQLDVDPASAAAFDDRLRATIRVFEDADVDGRPGSD